MLAVRIRAFGWFATGVVVTLIASVMVMNAWRADAAPGDTDCTTVTVPAPGPYRILETRDTLNPPAVGNIGLNGPLVGGVAQKLQVTGTVPTSRNGSQLVVPVGAKSVTGTVTVVGPTGGGFISVRPGDATGRPATSNQNFTAGVNIANSVTVGLSADGKVDIFLGGVGQAEVLFDVAAYCTSESLISLQQQINQNAAAIAALQNGDTPTTTAPTTTAPGTPVEKLNISERQWKIAFQGDIPGFAEETSNILSAVRFAVVEGDVIGIPGDNGNSSDGGDDSFTRGGTIGSSPNRIKLENGKFQSTAPYDPIGSVATWDLTDLSYDSNTGEISGKFTRTDGGNTDTGIFKMGAQKPTLPSPVVPPLPAKASGGACSSSTDFSLDTRTMTLTGLVPGKAPKLPEYDIRFAVSDGAITSQSSVKYDGTNPPYTWANGFVVCDSREVMVFLNNNQVTNPPNADRGMFMLQNVVEGSGGFVGEYAYDDDAPYFTSTADIDDVGTFEMS